MELGIYAGHGAWHDGVRAIYEKLTYDGAASEYSDYLSGVDSSDVKDIAQGIKIPDYDFIADQDAQDWRGKENGEWTINGKK